MPFLLHQWLQRRICNDNTFLHQYYHNANSQKYAKVQVCTKYCVVVVISLKLYFGDTHPFFILVRAQTVLAEISYGFVFWLPRLIQTSTPTKRWYLSPPKSLYIKHSWSWSHLILHHITCTVEIVPWMV